MVLPHHGGVISKEASSYATALQDHWFWLGTWWVLVFVGHVIVYWEKKYSEVHSEAVYVISLNHMQKLVKPTYVFCVLLCLKWYSLVSCLLYVYTNLW